MLKTILFLALVLGSAYSQANTSISAKLIGNAQIETKNGYTLITLPIHVVDIQSSIDLENKYVLLSNGSTTADDITAPCRAYQVFQTALYRNDIQSVVIAVDSGTNPDVDCSSATHAIANAKNLKVMFNTALLSDGSGTDVAPFYLQISK